MSKMQMEGLFTFSSEQLKQITKRPSSTDNPPNIRKRIITSHFSKKQSLLSQASTREELPPLSKEKKISSIKKVTFLLDSPIFAEDTIKSQIPMHLMKTRSLAEQDNKEGFYDDIYEKIVMSRYAPSTLKEKDEDSQPSKKTLSKEDKVVQVENTANYEEKQNMSAGTVRQKRTFSFKLSPKIVPVSQRRLPKAFKIKYVGSSLSKDVKPKAKDENLNKGEQRQKLLIENNLQRKVIKRSRFEEMFLTENKQFEGLYHLEL